MPQDRTASITGITGHDGSHLTEQDQVLQKSGHAWIHPA